MRKVFLAALALCVVALAPVSAEQFQIGFTPHANTTSRAWTPPLRLFGARREREAILERAAKRVVAARKAPRQHVARREPPRERNRASLVHGFMADAQSPLLAKALRDVGRNPTGWSHQWCGRQMALWVGHGPNLASAWARVGSPSSARPGVIAVMSHHVGVVKAVGPGYVILVAGNHSGRSGHRVVGEGRYPMSRIIAFRAP